MNEYRDSSPLLGNENFEYENDDHQFKKIRVPFALASILLVSIYALSFKDQSLSRSIPELANVFDMGQSGGSDLKAVAGHSYFVHNAHPDFALSIQGSTIRNGAVIKLWEKDADSSHLWIQYSDGTIRPANNINFCMTLQGGVRNRQNIVLWQCTAEAAAQKWLFHEDGTIRYIPDTNFVIDLRFDRAQNGGIINLMRFNNLPSQYWARINATESSEDVNA